MRRAGRAGAGEEERLPSPRGSAASRRTTTVPRAGPRRGPRGRPSQPVQPRDLDGETVTAAQKPAAAPPLALGPSRSRTQGPQKMTPRRRQTPSRPSPAPPRASLLRAGSCKSASNLPPSGKALKPTNRLPPPQPSPGVEGKCRAGSTSGLGAGDSRRSRAYVSIFSLRL